MGSIVLLHPALKVLLHVQQVLVSEFTGNVLHLTLIQGHHRIA